MKDLKKAVFEIETTEGRVVTVTSETAIGPRDTDLVLERLQAQPGVRKVHLIGRYDEALTYAVNELMLETLFAGRCKTDPVEHKGRTVRVSVPED